MKIHLLHSSTLSGKASMTKVVSTLVVFGVLFIASLVVTGCAVQARRSAPPLTVSSIVQQSHQGVPASAIIRQITESGTVYRLSASELANLRDDGVADSVINYMQQTYLDAIRRNQRLADQNLWVYGPDGYWYGGYPFGWPYYYVPYTPVHTHHHERKSEHRASADTQSNQLPENTKSAKQ